MSLEIDWRSERGGASLFGPVEAVSAQARRRPHSLAVISPLESITYGELEAGSNRLAHELEARGVGLRSAVGLYTERSPAFVVGALAIMKAGGAYVPIDPGTAPQRIEAILRDCGAELLLSHQGKAADLPYGPWATLDIDMECEAIAAQCAEPLECLPAAGSPAYLIYRTDWKGVAKATAVTHGELARSLRAHQKQYAVTTCDYASQIAGLAGDAAVGEIWCNLGAGALLHMIGDANELAPEPLRDWLVREEITIAHVPARLADRLRALDWPAHTALRALVTGA
jgi:non-ribosomal peptide synthetase component F